MLPVKPIYNITPFTLLDYPDKTACIVWFAGCNMQCVYCYNPDIVNGKGRLSIDDTLKFLSKRINLIDAVVLSGGECTQYKELAVFIKKIKKLGMLVKIDTNGSNLNCIRGLINKKLIDYIALDFKALEIDYFKITKSKLYNRFINTLEYLIDSKFKFEIRTTVHDELISSSQLIKMMDLVYSKGYRGIYYLQNFRNDTQTLGGVGNSEKLILPDIFYKDLKLVIRN